jgi:alpha-maltose-1-phosphate synthase
MFTEGNKKALPLSVLLIDSDGLSNYTSYLARGLSLFCDVTLYGFSLESYDITGASKQKNIKFYYFKKRLPKGYSALGGLVRVFILFFILLNALFRTKYDVVHVQQHLPTFFLFIPVLKLRKTKICWTLHDVEIYSPGSGISGIMSILFLRLVSQPSLMTKLADSIIVHADSLKNQLVAKGTDEKKIFVVRHFDYRYLLEENVLSTESQDELGDNYVLFFGSIAPWKGVEVLIDAAKVVRRQVGKKFDLVIAGEPLEGYKHIPFFKGLDRGDYGYIKILNRWITSAETYDIIRKSSFLVLPYNTMFRSSASGVVPLAYTFAKPVIVSSIPSLAEYVEHGETGFIFETNNSTQLASYMIKLVNDFTKPKEMGKKAFQKMGKEMSLERCARETWTVYCLN